MPTFEHTFGSPEAGTTHKGDPTPAYGVTTTTVASCPTGAWEPLILGTDVCGGGDGLKRPQWMVGAPTPVITAAHCNPTDYHD
jgi:hypothetical protein